MKASDFLKAGIGHMDDRAETYDAPEGERSMERTVKMFTELTGVNMTAEQGWKFMICLKLVRSEQGPFKADSYEDGAAYFGLAGEVASRYRAKPISTFGEEKQTMSLDMATQILSAKGILRD